MAVVLFRITAFIFHFCGMLTIYDINGKVRYSTPIYIGSKRVFKLMANDYITLHFKARNPIYFKLGDYCDVKGQGRFEVITPYQPAYDSATGGYKYELRMDAQYYKWKNKIMKFQPQFGSSETSWTLTATAETHLNQVLKNIYALAHHHNGGFNARYLYNGEKDWQISIDKSVDASAKTIAYDKTNIINALNAIAEKYECEWWVAENTIHLGKVEDDNPYIDLELGVNVAEMSRSNSKENYATRIIPFGSDRNISPRYRKDLIFDVKAQKNGGNLICDTARVMQPAWFTTYTEGNNKVENLTLQVIASNGTVEKEYTGVIFNPDNADSFTERNWFKLPNGSVLDTGVRFRIVEVNDFKVKSSYFSSKYSAYDDYNNIIKNGIVTRRLMLPESYGKGYVDVENNLPEEQGVEDVVIFEEVYPKAIATVTTVETVERSETIQNDDGTETEGKFKAYIINDDFFTAEHPFKEEYIIPGKTLQITFQDGKRYKEGDDIPAGKTVGDLINPESGKLNGWTFDVHFIPAKGGAARWELKRDNDNYIPNEIIRPHIGDQFVLVNFDTRAVDDLYVAEAEKELLDRTKKYIEKLNIDPSTYDCTMMSDVMKAGLHMELGTRINLLNKAYLPVTTDKDGRRWGRKSRVIGFEYNLDIPWDNPKFTIGEKPKYSKFGEITQRLDALNYSMADVSNIAATNTQSSGSEVYVIGLNDITAANDQNVYSSLRSRIEFLSRSAPETVSYQWDFEGGITVGQYLANNTGAAIDDLGNAEVNSLQARQASVIENDLSVYGVLDVAKETKAGDAVTVGTFRPGVSGAKMWIDNNGETHIETDYMEARKKFSAKEVEIQEETHVGGCQIISPAAMRCSRVVPITESGKIIAYKCFFAVENPDGVRIENQFRIGDLAKCETFNLVKRADGKTGNHYFWREVEEVGYVTEGDADYLAENGEEGFIRLSNLNGKMDMGSDAPLAGDRIVTVGNRSITERQNLIILASYGSGSPYIYQYSGINTFSLTQQNLKTAISPNGNLFTGRFVVECDDGTTKTLAEYMDDASNIDLYMMSLSNEALCVNCNDDGTIIGQQPVVNVAIYCGKKLETTWTVKIACAGCTATLSGKQITLQSVQDSTATIKVTATKAGLPTLEKTIAVASVRNGDKGDKGDKGADGRGVVSTSITYQLGDSGTTPPTGTWSSNVPTLTKGKYLWTRSITTYTTGNPTTLYSVSYIAKDGNNGTDGLPGKDGVGITSTTVTYAKSASSVTVPTSGWQTTIPYVPAGQYLWTKTVWQYSDGTSETGYSVARQGLNGTNGTNGVGISNVTNKYAVNNDASTAPTTWQDGVPTMTPTNRYLWNYEIITYTNGTTSETDKRVIGVYGNDGANGKGISAITEHYLATPLNSGVTTSTSGWTTSIQTITNTNKYLWNYEKITYTDGTNANSTPVIIGVYGDQGDKGDKGDSGEAGQDGVYYEIEPSALVVLKDMDGVCSPSKLTCSVYQTSGNNTRKAITFSNGSASIPGVTQTVLLLYQMSDADGKVISNGGYPDSGLVLNDSVATIEFWLYFGILNVGKRTIPVMLDPTSMKSVFETRFEVNEQKIEAITKRVDGNSEAIAKVQQTADGISAVVEKHTGVLGDLIEGAGRNLLLKTNSGGTNWGYRSDSTAMISPVAFVDNGEYVHNPYKVSVNARTDGTYERFYCQLRPEVIRVGEKYTFGVTIKLSRATTVPLQFSVRIANLDGTSDLTDTAYFDVPIGIDEYRITATMTATANGEKNGTQYLLFETIPLNINKWLELTLSDEKLELGSTATAYSEAPEDREDYLYSSLSTKIDVTARGIRSEVKASDDALGERMSVIEQTAEEISTRVESAEGEISEINQKADSISLKVEDVVGVKNLVPDYSTGKGWEVRQNEGSWSKIAPTNGVYNINNTQRTVKTLRTPAFRLEANKHYTLSFTNTKTPVSSASVKIVHGDEQTELLNESLLMTSSGTRKSFTFETSGTALEMVRVLFSVRPANLGNSSRLNVSEVMVEEGDKAHAFTDNTSGLLGTGIDISNHKIVITSDNILIRTNNGVPSMFINSEGKIYAHYIDVDNITVRRLIAGDENGARVEINPDEGHRSVEIYNEDGNLCTTLNGLTFNGGADDFYGDTVSGNVNLGTSIKGSLSIISTGDTVSDEQDYYSSVWESKTPTKVTVNAGAVYLYARSAGFTETGELQFINHRTTASIAMYLEHCADNSFSSSVSRWLVFSKHVMADSAQIAGNPHPVEVVETKNENGECIISGKNAVSTVSGGYFRLRLQVAISAKGAGSEAKAQWGSAIDRFGVDIKVQYTDEGYVSNFFANGFCLGVRRDAYVTVFRDATSEMNVQCKMGQYGINLSSKGIEYCHHGGGWMKVPLLVMHAYVRWVSASTVYNVVNYMSCSSKAPTVTRVNKGRVLVSLPTGSPGISLANAIIHVTAKSTTSKVFNASVIAVNAATVEVALANGGNFDDCDFLIDVYWAGTD